MFKIIVFTHGELSEGLLNTADLITGINKNIEYFTIFPGCDTEIILSEVCCSIENALKSNLGVLVFTDLFFGTPFNLIMSVSNKYKFSHVTGVNLPMLLEAITYQSQTNMDMNEIVKDLVVKGKESIVDCNSLVEKILNSKEV